MRCGACGGDTPETQPFCGDCGTRLAGRCAACGAGLIAGKPFCTACGAAVDAGAAQGRAVAGPPDAAERRLCSVLFVDLVGFTPWAERTDPEVVRELLEQYFDRARSIVDNYGGTVEKFIGDAVMAVWGAPVANEDDAERAVRAGLDIVAAVERLGRDRGDVELRSRAGIVTGEVAVTVGREAEGMVMGDAVNVASRLQTAAEPGSVLVDEATWRASSGAISFEVLEPLTLKGKAAPVAAWRATRVVAQRKGLGRAEGLEPPFVGRDDELRLVKELLQATERERSTRLVSVTGVPGIGKSRLAWEFEKYVDGLVGDVYWHVGRSATYGGDVTFGALGEMVRMRAGITDADDPGAARHTLEACVAEYVTDADERRWIEPRLAHLLGLADGAAGDRDELFSAWRSFFERIAERGITVLVFEDFQWADAGLIDFVESILEWSRRVPIMIVTLSRPELLDRRPTWGAGQRSFTSLHLDPLTDEEMTTLLDGFVHGLPAEVVDKIRQRAEGVPLYAVETVRSLVNRGVLATEGGIYRVVGELGALDIPETLHALVAARLDALSQDERALLQDAAVLGTTIRPETLAVVHGTSREALEPMLRDLVKKEFLRLDLDPRSPDRGQYGFVQGVIGDVALSMLPRRERSAKHLVLAEHFESLDDDDLTVVVATQYASALRAAPDGDADGSLVERTATWLARAGERALSLGSPAQALELIDQALALTPEGPARAPLLESAGDASLRDGDPDRSITMLTAASDLYQAARDRTGVARVQDAIAYCYRVKRDDEQVIAVAEAAYVELGETGDLKVRAQLATSISGGYSQRLESEKALEWAEVALAAAEQLGDTVTIARALCSRSQPLFDLGRGQEALLLSRGMLSLAEDAGALREQGVALQDIALYLCMENPMQAIEIGARSFDVLHRYGNRRQEVLMQLNIVEWSIDMGQWESAARVMEETTPFEGMQTSWMEAMRASLEALTGDVGSGTARMEAAVLPEQMSAHQATILNASAVVRLAAGDLDGSRRVAFRAVQSDPLGLNGYKSIRNWARAALWEGHREDVASALIAVRRLHGAYISAMERTIEAGLAALDGLVDEAIATYEDAVARYRALGCEYDLALAALDASLVLGPDRVPSLAEQAEAHMSRVGARPFLDRLAEARARA